MVFPKDFLFGAATSAYQVEGGNNNNNWFEAASRGLVPPAGNTCDSYHRFEEDFDLARSLGHNAHRLSLEWSRLEPQEGEWDLTAVDHYRRVLRAVHDREMKTFVTLWHFTSPRWLSAVWEDPKTVDSFARYVKFCAEKFGDLVDFWSPLNEPSVYVSQGYIISNWPPFSRNLFKILPVIKNLRAAHKAAYRAIHEVNPNAFVGPVNHYNDYVPHWQFLTPIASLIKYLARSLFDHPLKNYQDFIGVNYYQTFQIGLGIKSLGTNGQNDLGWGIHPEGLYKILQDLAKRFPQTPIYITENGIADKSDTRRQQFIKDHLEAVNRALAAGVNVRGYLHWSLLDNYEWADGFGPRFGLIEVNYNTQERRVRPSAYWFRDFIISTDRRTRERKTLELI